MAVSASTEDRGTEGAEVPRVDPRAPRFGQAITASGLVLGIVFDLPVLIYAVAVVLLAAVLTRWQYDPYGIVWKHVVRPRLESREPEAAAPHRFAKLMGAVGTTLASALIIAGVPLAGYVIAGAVAVAAGLAATTGFCLGCRMYQSVSLFRRLDVV